MPVRAYRFYRVKSFPELDIGESVKTRYQPSLVPREVDHGPRTVLTSVGLSDLHTLKKVHVLHETEEEVRGRYRNEPIRKYIAEVEFHLFYNPVTKVMYADAKGKICREMLKRLAAEGADLEAERSQIDLVRLAQDIQAAVTGGWFGNLKIADVSTAALFGGTVGESDEWKRYSSVGDLKALNIVFDLGGRFYKVQITLERTIVIFSAVTESEALELVEEIQKQLDNYEISK